MAFADLFRAPKQPEPPIAGVAHVISAKKLEDKPQRSSDWQHEAWRVWEGLGEIHYPTTQIARLISRLDWNVDGIPTSDPEQTPSVDIKDLFADPGLAEVTREIALNLIVAGEGWLTRVGDTWTVYSVVEPSLNTKLAKTDIKIRVWTPDPRDSERADSGVRAAIGPAQELLMLQKLSMAQARSRAASAGLLLRPNTRLPLVDDEGEPIDFTEMLHAAMTAAIEDADTTAAVVPIDLELPADEIELWKHLQFGRPYDERVDIRMERVIRRIALALDIWPELLLGVADINHWGSWFLSEDTWRSSTAPLANQVGQALEEATSEALDKRPVIEPDPAVLLARRSSVRDALNAAWIGGISLKYLREVIGATEEDAPPPEDLEIIRLMAGQRRSESRAGITTEEENIVTSGTGDTEPVLGAAGDLEGGLGVELVRVDDQLSAWLEGAAEATITTTRGAIGVRLRRALRGNKMAVQIDAVDNIDAAAHIGEATFDLLDVDMIVRDQVAPLVARWGDRLELAKERITDLIPDLPIPEVDWADAKQRSQDLLADTLRTHITTHLTEERPPLVDLRKVVTVAGLD